MDKKATFLPPFDPPSDPSGRIEELRNTLNSREQVYGEFTNIAALSTTMRYAWEKVLYSNPFFNDGGRSLVSEAANMILHKLARIASGDPYSRDSWMDIAGYAMRTVMEMDRIAAEFCEQQKELEKATKEKENSNGYN